MEQDRAEHFQYLYPVGDSFRGPVDSTYFESASWLYKSINWYRWLANYQRIFSISWWTLGAPYCWLFCQLLQSQTPQILFKILESQYCRCRFLLSASWRGKLSSGSTRGYCSTCFALYEVSVCRWYTCCTLLAFSSLLVINYAQIWWFSCGPRYSCWEGGSYSWKKS